MDNCPHCNKSLIGEPIPEEARHLYSTPYHWTLEIGVVYPEKYDGIWEYRCPFCNGTWPSAIQILANKEASYEKK
jgi:hypothetical protein